MQNKEEEIKIEYNKIPLKKSLTKIKTVIEEPVLKKIETLCARYPNEEWSGVAFYDFEGSISDLQNLIIKVKDIYIMDIGSGTFTSFSHSSDFVGYLTRNLDLMDYRQGLIHSHNRMRSFFSGTDTNTLREYAYDYNVFFSLIVNNVGQYVASLAYKQESIIKGKASKIMSYTDVNREEITSEEEEREFKNVVTEIIYSEAIIEKENIDLEFGEEFANMVALLDELKKNKGTSYKREFTESEYKGNLVIPNSTSLPSKVIHPNLFNGYTDTRENPFDKHTKMFSDKLKKDQKETIDRYFISLISLDVRRGFKTSNLNIHSNIKTVLEELVKDDYDVDSYFGTLYAISDLLIEDVEKSFDNLDIPFIACRDYIVGYKNSIKATLKEETYLDVMEEFFEDILSSNQDEEEDVVEVEELSSDIPDYPQFDKFGNEL